MMIARTDRELVVVHILGTDAPLDLLQLLLKAARGIAETLEDTTDGTDITVFPTYTVLIVGIALALLLGRNGRHEQFVGIGSDGETVPFIDRYHQRGTQSHVGGQELTLLVAEEGDLRTDVGEVQTKAQLTLATAEINVFVIIHGQVGSKG